MAATVTDLIKQYYEAKPHADPSTRDWFLINQNPVYVWCITVAYFTCLWLGPKYMKTREPFKLQWFLVVYNMGCVALSLYMAVEIILTAIDNEYDWLCQPYNEETRKNPKEYRMNCVMYWYFFSKVIELLDTVLMVLRKKNSQITFLHVFHHISMLNIWWWVMMFIPSSLSFFGALMNCWVHVVMYLYYGLSAIPSLRGKLWWKNWLTKFQLIQFVVTFSHSMNTIYQQCDFPNWGKYLLAGYMIILFTLFSNFYIHAYIMRRHAKQSSKLHSNGHTLATNGSTANELNNSVSNGHSYHNGVADKKTD